ncbi:sodium/alanine symporter protein [Alphaproteobacteria bacterium]|nr:sodium/alanine symporter protein [Alphaproteobacteria bacterium]
MPSFFNFFSSLDEILWGYVDFYIILLIGLYFTFKSKFFQFKTCAHPFRAFHDLATLTDSEKKKGVNPISLYFSSVGGAIGIGNIGGVVGAVSLGGPGGLFWMWVAVLCGALVKYAECYLGILYRKPNEHNSYDGGAMFYLKHVFPGKSVPTLFCVLLCIYGAEVFQFKVVEDVFVETFHWNRILVLAGLLAGTFYVLLGGVLRLSKVCRLLMPIFLLLYTSVCLYVIAQHASELSGLFRQVFKTAFTGQAAVGGFAGSSFVIAVQQGMSKAVYSGDIGMGYDSVIQSETQITHPHIQARTSIFTLFTDCFICTMTVLLVLVTGQWCSGQTHGFDCVVAALSPYFSHVPELMALFFFLAGWTTILGYLTVGLKSAKALGSKGPIVYMLYAFSVFTLFSFVDQNSARLVMSIAGGFMILINLAALFKLRKEISFS